MAITVQAGTFCFAACAVLLPWPACVLLSEGNSMLPFAPVAALMVLNVLLLRPLWWPHLSGSQTSTADKTVEAPAVPKLALEADVHDEDTDSVFEV